ncbi:rhamnulokinase [Companilactobacillus sp.]|jgi:rhamnulokinase|uniref:rhamnulokinase n=1 Tax=Companilactobacillus sp. TaxID=2767905 RepID=UPI0025BCF7DF|nr:rhamnulokinase family protein [Companilactobacillus sp.]MCH4009571.1 rhamnulokinase [Companilactobacillus sp.]MCH4052753.1 rhamnulokinase [Companilactobacillus sp.]MCH4077513.1 rhamnulokinase [Companilactobacillus sp.]MCH4126089.1 rhamnulokinase [Companilactobacillus sp.]MCI1311797.1 rhamnulokinase [Companilactobacillus sp.]
MKHNVIAVDLGASSGRIISSTLEDEKLELKEQFRFSNQPINITNSLYWDYLKIFQEIKYGLAIAQRDLEKIQSLSVDTWGVDYGFVGHDGNLLATPHSYRDTRVKKYEDDLHEISTPREMFNETGVQPSLINSNYQLFADMKLHPYLQDEISHIMFMPNLVEYFFSGKVSNEFTIASTSGLLDGKSRELSTETLDQLGLKKEWFGDISKGGKVLGNILPAIATEMHLDPDIQIINGIGHDTGAAVYSLPMKKDEAKNSAFISCGTWSIVGQQTDEPVITSDAYEAGLTNEGCIDGSNRLLKNITGLWIVQELQKEWSFKGEMVEFGEMVKEAEQANHIGSYINPNAACFSEPSDMEERIIEFLKQTNQTLPETRGELLLIVFESLALSYHQTIVELEKATNESIDTIYMFGGGTKNSLLVQLTANFCQTNVVIGPTEASVLGNVLSQYKTLGLIKNEDDRINILNNSFESKCVTPQNLNSINLDERTRDFENILHNYEVE